MTEKKLFKKSKFNSKIHLSTCTHAYYCVLCHKSLMIFMANNMLPLSTELYRMNINNKTKKLPIIKNIIILTYQISLLDSVSLNNRGTQYI